MQFLHAKERVPFFYILLWDCRQLCCNGRDPAHIAFEQDILTRLAGSGRLFALPVFRWWSQVKTAGSAIYANRHYLALYKQKHPKRLASASNSSCYIIGDVYIHPSATVHPTSVVRGINCSLWFTNLLVC